MSILKCFNVVYVLYIPTVEQADSIYTQVCVLCRFVLKISTLDSPLAFSFQDDFLDVGLVLEEPTDYLAGDLVQVLQDIWTCIIVTISSSFSLGTDMRNMAILSLKVNSDEADFLIPRRSENLKTFRLDAAKQDIKCFSSFFFNMFYVDACISHVNLSI